MSRVFGFGTDMSPQRYDHQEYFVKKLLVNGYYFSILIIISIVIIIIVVVITGHKDLCLS